MSAATLLETRCIAAGCYEISAGPRCNFLVERIEEKAGWRIYRIVGPAGSLGWEIDQDTLRECKEWIANEGSRLESIGDILDGLEDSER